MHTVSSIYGAALWHVAFLRFGAVLSATILTELLIVKLFDNSGIRLPLYDAVSITKPPVFANQSMLANGCRIVWDQCCAVPLVFVMSL